MLLIGKAVLATILIIIVVQLLDNQEVYTVDASFQYLPVGVQKILAGNNHIRSWQCPYCKLLSLKKMNVVSLFSGKSFDIFYTCDRVMQSNETTTNVIQFIIYRNTTE